MRRAVRGRAVVGTQALEGYAAALAAWRERLRSATTARRGRYLEVRSDAALNRLLVHDWRQLGVIAW